MERIPKHARKQAAELLTEVLESCITGNDVPAWTRLFTFSYDSFSLPPGDRKGNLTTIINNNLLHGANDHQPTNALDRQPAKPGPSKLRKAVERKLQRGDISGAVRLLASEDAVATPTADVYEILKTKHPPDKDDPHYPAAPANDDPTAATVMTTEVLRSITTFSHGSAGGLDGLCPQDLQDMVSELAGGAATRLLENLATLLTTKLRGGVSPEVCPLLYGASLTALRKPDSRIRPIAVGNVRRRLAGKIVSHRVMEEMGTLVRPTQLGYGTRGGCEAAVHATRAFLEEEKKT